jgi:WD40 repeat protein
VGGGDPAVVDVGTRRVIARMSLLPEDEVDNLGFSPDGRVVLAILESSSEDRASLVRFAAATGAQLGRPRPLARADAAALMVAPDGRVVTSRAGGPTVVRDGRTLQPLRRFAAGAAVAALSPDGRTVILGGADGSVRFLDLRSAQVRTGAGRHTGAVVGVTYSADGRTAATAGEDDRVIAWNVARAAPRATLSGHAAAIAGLALTPRGDTLYSTDADGRTIVWDLAGTRRFGRAFGTGSPVRHPSPPQYLIYALGGGRLAVGHDDGRVSVIDARTLRTLRTFPAVPGGPVRGLAFVPGGGPLVVGGNDGHLALYDTRSGTRLQRLRGQYGAVVRISLSADGSRMATLSGQDSVALWTLRHGRVTGPPRLHYPTYVPDDLSLSPDGHTLALGSPGSVELVDAGTFARRAIRRTGLTPDLLSPFTPDGRWFVVSGHDGSAQLWSARTLRPVTRRFGAATDAVLWASMSPDGRTLATGSPDGTVQLFDVAGQAKIGPPLTTLANDGAAPAFSADGAYLYALTDAGVGYRWDVRPGAWAARACAVAGRPLTRAEWSAALPGRSYAPACAGSRP